MCYKVESFVCVIRLESFILYLLRESFCMCYKAELFVCVIRWSHSFSIC